jgi:hypothetical protein
MKITKAKLKQIIKEELSSVSEGGAIGHYEGGEGSGALDRHQQKEYAMALSTVLGISTEEVESMSPLEISELGTHIRNHYRNKLNKRPPPLGDPHRTGEFTPREG